MDGIKEDENEEREMIMTLIMIDDNVTSIWSLPTACLVLSTLDSIVA